MGVSRFSLEFLCLTVPKISVGNPLLLHYFRLPKKFGEEGGWEYQDFPSKFFVSQCRKSPLGILYCCLISGYRKSLDRRGGSIKIIRPIFLSHSVEKFRRGILYCCINFRWRKSLWTRGGKGVSRFSIKDFLSHSAENLRRELFTVALFSGTEKVWIEWGEYQDNPSIFFVSQCRKLP